MDKDINKKEFVWVGDLRLNVAKLDIISRRPGLFAGETVTFVLDGVVRESTIYTEDTD